MIVVDKWTCLIMTLVMFVAIFSEYWLDVRHANRQLEIMSKVVILFSDPPVRESYGTKLNSMAASGPVASSLRFCRGVWLNLLSVFDSMKHCLEKMILFLIICALFG